MFRDNVSRIKIAELEKDICYLKRRIEILEESLHGYRLESLERKFNTIVSELGFSFNDNDVFDGEVKNENSSLGKLQLQINALLRALRFEEVWTNGTLTYRKEK